MDNDTALHLTQDKFADSLGKYRDMSISEVIEYYESVRKPDRKPVDEEAISAKLTEMFDAALQQPQYQPHTGGCYAETALDYLRPYLQASQQRGDWQKVINTLELALEESEVSVG